MLAVFAAAVSVLLSMGSLPPAGAGASTRTATTATSNRVVAYVPLRGTPGAGPFDNAFENVDYNGGPIMQSTADYLVFWSPGGYSAYGSGAPPEYVSGLEQYFTDLAHDSGGHQNTDSVSTQYNDLTGNVVKYAVTFGGGILDTDPYPASECPVSSPVTTCLTDVQIQRELEKVARTHHVPAGLLHEFFLLTPPHVEGCFSKDASANPPYGGCSAGEVPSTLALYCAYHENTTVSPMLIYAVDPYVTGNPGCDDGNHPNGPSDGALEGGLSHEHNESITDPVPNDAWTNGAGAKQGSEIADQCEGSMGTPLGTAPDGASYNQVINGHFYWYQEEWSNQGHTCLQRFTRSGTVPIAKFAVSAGTGLTMTFNASASTASGGIADYSWQFNDSFGAQTVEQTTPVITHTFPSAATYSVGLTVYAKDGQSKGAGGIVTTGHNGFSAGFIYSPSSPTAGQPVTFRGLVSVSQRPVATYLWDFGDGSLGSGASPTHTYPAAGTYVVKVVEFSGVGSAWPGAGAAPVFAAKVIVG